MDTNHMEIIRLLIDAIARIIVPIVVVLLGRKPVENFAKARFAYLEKQIREHIQGCSDEQQAFIDKTLNEVYAKPQMRWYR